MKISPQGFLRVSISDDSQQPSDTIRSHCQIIYIIACKIFKISNLIVKVTISDKIYYLNKKSLDKWLKNQGVIVNDTDYKSLIQKALKANKSVDSSLKADTSADSPLKIVQPLTYTKDYLDRLFPLEQENAEEINRWKSDKSIDELKTKIDERNRKLKTYITILDHINPRKISINNVILMVKDAVERHDRNSLRLLAQILFDMGSAEHFTNSESVWSLSQRFFHPGLNELCLGKMIIKAFKDRQNNYIIPLKTLNYHKGISPPSKDSFINKNGNLDSDKYHDAVRRWRSYKDETLWLKNYIDNLETKVDISHGGGLNFIQRFMKGEIRGYPLEFGKPFGLQVSLNTNSRDHGYATKAWLHFDIPATLKASVKYREVIPANNYGYEAGIDRPLEEYTLDIDPTNKASALNSLFGDKERQIYGEEIADLANESMNAFFALNPSLKGKVFIDGIPAGEFMSDPPSDYKAKLDDLRSSAWVSV